jgi:hypothetical protein
MHKYAVLAAYGWLVLTGMAHFLLDVVSQYLRGIRSPGVETTLYYGLNSAFAMGQLAFGLLGLLVARRAMHLLGEVPVRALSIAVAFGWLAITFLFMDYWEPRVSASIFAVLVIIAALAA